MNKLGKFLKKLPCFVGGGGSVLGDNLVSSTELILYINHLKSFLSWNFER